MSKKIGIVLSHINRQEQLYRTLQSIEDQQPDNIIVVVVDDGSDKPIELPRQYYFPLEILVIAKAEKNWTNSEVALNAGIEMVIRKGAKIIMVQGAETYHEGPVIEYARKHTKENNYLTFSCKSMGRHGAFEQWYNHPVHHPVAYDFCASITKKNVIALNGYDERLAFGVSYGDVYWLDRIRWLGLKVEIVEEPVVCHQWHLVCWVNLRGELVQYNQKIYQELIQKKEIKAQRVITNNLI